MSVDCRLPIDDCRGVGMSDVPNRVRYTGRRNSYWFDSSAIVNRQSSIDNLFSPLSLHTFPL